MKNGQWLRLEREAKDQRFGGSGKASACVKKDGRRKRRLNKTVQPSGRCAVEFEKCPRFLSALHFPTLIYRLFAH